MISPQKGQEKGDGRTVKMTIYLSEETRKALRIRAIEDETSATKLVERLILDYLKSKPKRGS